MIKEPYISINCKQLLNFKFLCKTIRNNSIDKLAVTFAAIAELKEKVDDPDVVYYLGEDISVTLHKTKSSLLLPMPVFVYSTLCTLWDWVREVKENLDEYIWVYNMLADDWSKQTFHMILLCRFLMDVTYLHTTYKPIQYFDKELIKKREEAVLVDGGAFDGGSALSFAENYGLDYKRIYSYEPDPSNFNILKENTASLHDIEYRNCGIGEVEMELRFYSGLWDSSFFGHQDTQQANTVVPIISLDNDIKEPITFIKLDIEGSEMSALRGAKLHIINDKPQLAICVYHLLDDLRTIPRLIHEYNKNQRFYIRNHLMGFGVVDAFELIFYADPYTDGN